MVIMTRVKPIHKYAFLTGLKQIKKISCVFSNSNSDVKSLNIGDVGISS